MLKSMATELLRDTLDLFPQCHQIVEATGRKASSDSKTEGSNGRETSKVAGGGTEGEDMDSGGAPDWDVCFDQNDARGR